MSWYGGGYETGTGTTIVGRRHADPGHDGHRRLHRVPRGPDASTTTAPATVTYNPSYGGDGFYVYEGATFDNESGAA